MNTSREPRVGLAFFLMVLSVVLPISSGVRFGYRARGMSGALIGIVVGVVFALVSCGGVWALGTFVSKWVEPRCMRLFGAKGRHVNVMLGLVIMVWIAFCFVATAAVTQKFI
jgi:hypothetical protein